MTLNKLESDSEPSQIKEEAGMKQYRTEDLIVYWDPKQCSHAGKCWQGLPQVFKPDERPWITMAAAKPEQIIETIDKCPTDALKYKLTEGSKVDPGIAKGPGSIDYKRQQSSSIKINMVKNGPLKVEGSAQIFDPDGNFIKESSHIVLCSCGKTSNKPFCDGSHAHKL